MRRMRDDAPRPVSLDDVLAAREAIGGRLHRTPTFTSRLLTESTGADVHLKAELFQRTGSFKPRGVLTNLAALSADEKARGVIGISAGNHAGALAYGAALEGVSALLVMWQGASATKIEATRAYGAEVDLVASGPGEAFDRLRELIDATGRTLVHPFDSPATIAGQGTVGLEIAEDVPDADVVVVPIGGGGLIAGVVTAVKGLRPAARVIGVEPEGPRSREAGASRPCLDRGRPQRALRRRAHAADRPRPGRRGRPRLRGRDRRRDAPPLRARQAGLRAGGGGRDGGAPERESRVRAG
jgi:threonine dehydratase